uniref:PH domain-containing protein n=1 Tax=Attheya septentrionalis TaxID=420275 RepID=A0A7S2UJG2_9STRA|mmetsp:Transcript_28163/g.51296  ORF Transcript_28163/g.51296 Transcript_28163/m.51296 type:complete len:212 (+) Transcript_28163:117-752(+)|eukprot:CAMPEP_0198282430 /NCGR_PEP_ID=MMETSP1449-20131203/2255_1 /TAXON_ID=420275 /ORGANISM="Attheya septentrionalis, Strain CCMP2084" /LENGTH=211 /DNA_ID=CAMNT_0043978687 /DNA_START=100 /DNA_END=735 /DNA_ORIENTATION=-
MLMQTLRDVVVATLLLFCWEAVIPIAESAFLSPNLSQTTSYGHKSILQVASPQSRANTRHPSFFLRSTEEGNDEALEEDSKIDNILKDIHSQGFPFRVVVIGNGAILETTSVLGPHFAESTSPKTGERLVTFASDDRSFEFHLKVDQIAKVTFSEKDRIVNDNEEKRKLRITRFINEMGNPICSLILADSSKEAADWFTSMTIRYGYEVQL